jgi:hypothetical protein
MRATFPAHLILLYSITVTIFVEEYPTNYEAPHYVIVSVILPIPSS